MNLSAMLFNVPILIGLFSCQGVGWCKELTLSNNRVLHEFFTSNTYWTAMAAVVLHFGGMLFLFIAMQSFIIITFFWVGGGGSGSVNCTRFPNLKISVALQSKIYSSQHLFANLRKKKLVLVLPLTSVFICKLYAWFSTSSLLKILVYHVPILTFITLHGRVFLGALSKQ